MTHQISPLLKSLIALSKLDSTIALALAEQKKLRADIESRKGKLALRESELAQKGKAIKDRRAKAVKEEAEIKQEEQKLAARRQALETLNNYKAQQAGEREIESNAKLVHDRVDALLKTVDDVDKVQGLVESLAAQVEQERKTVHAFEQEAMAEIAALEEKLLRNRGERAALAANIEKPHLALYDRVCHRFPSDAVVAVEGGSCKGCFVQIGSQTVVQILKGETLSRCPGCGRILFIDEESAPKQERGA